MELISKELLSLEYGLDSLIAQYKDNIETIKQLDGSSFKSYLMTNEFRVEPLTVEDVRKFKIQKELDKIKEVEELKKKLFLSNSRILVVSKHIKLSLTDR